MRKKINSEAGFGLVEMLAAMMVMILLALMVGVGFQMASNSYRTVVAKSELELLVSTAIDALADDLRYARDVEGTSGTNVFTYTSDSFGKGTKLNLDGDRIVASSERGDNLQVLATGAYGLKVSDTEWTYKVDGLDITYHYDDSKDEITFKIVLTVTDGRISASTPKDDDGSDIGVTVRCLNPRKDTP